MDSDGYYYRPLREILYINQSQRLFYFTNQPITFLKVYYAKTENSQA
ncbi:MAG: hypothetical protein K0R50_4833 [Eubacterium sp.]|jgi:hypothetical protein|nr:hypothetical protein [Eubacterium sp.]